jgi:uncharacterized protein
MGLRFNLIPREMKFFDLFNQIGANLTQSSEHFLEMLVKFDNLAERGAQLKTAETSCDAVIEKIHKALDKSFITPFDREDIHTLASKLDDVMDNMEETGHRFETFRIDKPTDEAVQLARIIRQCCVHIEGAVKLLADLRNSEKIQEHILHITRLENEADFLYRKVDADLFATANGDLFRVIKWRELYAWLEETVDAAKEVAQVITGIVIKGT